MDIGGKKEEKKKRLIVRQDKVKNPNKYRSRMPHVRAPPERTKSQWDLEPDPPCVGKGRISTKIGIALKQEQELGHAALVQKEGP